MTQTLGPVMLDLEGTQLRNEERELLRHEAVGGVILFARNIEDAAQVRELCGAIRQTRPELLLAIDQEGGRVQRLHQGVTRIPSMAKLANTAMKVPKEGQRLCRDAGWLLGMEMAACGLDITFAPVLDVDTGLSSVIGDRSFGANAEQVTALAGALIEGLSNAGMAAVGKHYPGHGGVAADSHLELPIDERPLADIMAVDLLPFKQLASQLGGIMPAHVVYPAFDHRPAGFSPLWLGLLRETLGFKGTIFSDDLSMAGATSVGTPSERAQLALAAGCDMLLVCNDRAAALEVVEACSGQSTRRAGKLRYGRARPDLGTLAALGRWRRVHAHLESLCDD